jgi:uncharacterized membrane protein YecN with MAPEG domain
MLTHQTVFALYAGINGLILLFLGIMVTRQRVKSQTMILDAGKDEMIKATRAHANAVEYIPIVLLLLVALAWLRAPMWLMHIVGATLTAGRIFHAVGLYSSLGLTAWRFIGINLTWIALLIGSVATLVYAFI